LPSAISDAPDPATTEMPAVPNEELLLKKMLPVNGVDEE